MSWVLGFLMLVAHLIAAFQFAHHWSHEEAYRQTEATSGLGEGIFVNYLFGLVWFVDAIWLGFWPDHYARRPRWVGWFVHGFLAFIVVNATVVFGSPLIQIPSAVLFLVLPILFGWRRFRKDCVA